MGAHKANEQCSFVKENHRYQSIVIPFDVEDIAVITHVIDGVEGLLDIGQRFPVSGLHDSIPFIESRSRPGVLKAKLVEDGFGDDDH